ncbi:MAG: YlxR family protein [Candidatus Binatota bacterium]
MKRDYRPQRTCLGCGARDDQRALLRLVVQGNGELKVDRLEKGRGGYLHKTQECWSAFLRKKNLYRAFRLEVGRELREKLILTLRDRHWE